MGHIYRNHERHCRSQNLRPWHLYVCDHVLANTTLGRMSYRQGRRSNKGHVFEVQCLGCESPMQIVQNAKIDVFLVRVQGIKLPSRPLIVVSTVCLPITLLPSR